MFMTFKAFSLHFVLGIFFICFLSVFTYAQTKFPTPANTKERLFYLQRTPNANTVVYDINVDANGKVDIDDPVKVYWLKYANGGLKQELLGIEQKYAYGVKSMVLDSVKGHFKINLVSNKGIDIFLKPNTDAGINLYKALVYINGKLIKLERIFLNINGGTKMKPNITSVEFHGKDENNKYVIEKTAI